MRTWVGLVGVGLVGVGLMAGCAGAPGQPGPAGSPSGSTAPRAPDRLRAMAPAPTVTVAAVGDMACDPASPHFRSGRGVGSRCRQQAVSDLVLRREPDLLLALGDTQYDDGTAADYRRSYAPSYGRLLAVTRPVIGNHEYRTAGAAGYWDYFGAAAGDRGKGWYAFTAGTWRVIALNSNCDRVSCARDGAQLRWLRAELAANRSRCTLLMWHHPRWSNGSEHGDQPQVAPFMEEAYRAGADLVLAGHDHHYERFAPRRPDGAVDRTRGLRSFVVGTGGKDLRQVGSSPASRARSASSHGALFLTLEPGSYRWQFEPAAGGTFTDEGSATCH